MEPERKLSAEAGSLFQEGIGLVLSRWSALQLAVKNEWGGRDSRRKAEQLVADIFSWFNHSTEPLYIDDSEDMLNEAMQHRGGMRLPLNFCLYCNFKLIESLREANQRRVALPHVREDLNSTKYKHVH
ncbi:pre-rRNA-processing protein TSR2-like protein [Pyrus ussuriensis x Pyrus communis]|uniref:Pre-rRNA-processing protein TSR2-like protein n=1 Tax=Pyrus ussuriensis x Pyrus communis TaxID=2448454 RepID=A0A5N5GSC9_9ROSA|nr:pre-rRNA-processing protein TSR2-like protein [Pyrus ussuriensis x Pyrus communis]